MKKNLVVAIGILLLFENVLAQSELENQQKYWNYRDNLKKKFLKIGNLDPSGVIEFGMSIPLENRDQVNTNCSGTGNRMRWGDATIHLGYYLATLATEYELLRREGKDCQPTLNELYYAISAVNRLDDYGEFYLSQAVSGINRNGFLIRDDVYPIFKQNWLAPPDNVTCLTSDTYNTDNGSAGTNFFNEKNEMSQDQLYSLFLGFAFVKKFVDPSLVIRPTSQDTPMNLVGEVQSITNRIMSYIQQQWTESEPYWAGILCQIKQASFTKNWTIRNPVTGKNVHRGASMALLAPFTAQLGQQITGIPYNANVSFEVTFPGIEPQCFTGPIMNPSITFPLSTIRNLWTAMQNSTWNNLVVTLNNIPMLNMIYMITNNSVPSESISLDMGNINFSNSNRHMLMTLVSSTNSFTKANIGRLSWDADMGVFDLVRSQLNGGGTWAPQSDFYNLLNPAPCDGPKSLTPHNPNPWCSTTRWIRPGGSGFTGEYNGLDYMFLYNLYMLEFGNQVQLPYVNSSCPCAGVNKIDAFIDPTTSMLTQPAVIERKFPSYLNFNISVPDYLTQNVILTGTNNLSLQTELIVCNNSRVYSWASNSLVLGTPSGALAETGILRIRSGSSLIMEFNGEVVVHPYSKIIVEKGGSFIIRGNASLVVNDFGSVIVEPGATFTWENGTSVVMQGENGMFDIQCNPQIDVLSGEKFYIHNGNAATGGLVRLRDGTFTLYGGGILEIGQARFLHSDNSVFHYKPNADIRLLGDDATLSLWSNLQLDNSSVFTFSYTGSNSGQIQLGDVNFIAGSSCEVRLRGQGKQDVILQAGSFVTLPDNLDRVAFSDGAITGVAGMMPMSGLPTISTGAQPFYMNNCVSKNMDAIIVYGQKASFLNSDFYDNNFGIRGIYTGASFNNPIIAGCTFTRCNIPVYSYGLGVNMHNDLLHNNLAEGYVGVGLAFSSKINQSIFTDNNISNVGSHIAYSANSGSGITVSNSHLVNTPQTGGIGIDGSGGILNARCSEIAGNKSTAGSNAITASYNGYINLSNDYLAGFNNLSDNSSVIELHDSYADIINGGNNFATFQTSKCYTNNLQCNPFITGTVSGISCNGMLHVIPADHNYWGAHGGTNFSPGTKTFDLELASPPGCMDVVYYQDLSPVTPIACPTGNPVVFNGGTNNPLRNGKNVSTINTPAFPNTQLHDAVNSSIALMDTGQINGFKTATAYFTEIVTYKLSNPTPEDEYILSIAYRKLMESLSLAVEYSQLPDSMTTEHSGVMSYQTSVFFNSMASSDYRVKYNIALDRASTYRLAGDLQSAVSVMQDALSWADAGDLDHVNEWLCYYNAENNHRAGLTDRRKYLAELELCRRIPAGVVPRNGDITSSTNENMKPALVFPNPNDGNFILEMSDGIANVELFNASGSGVFRKSYNNVQRTPVELKDLPKGIYLLKAVSSTGRSQAEKILVQ